uniref:Uncharacterized protein n=1 Tax=Caldimicrobium thiodismutans TaxID=1653476 RepID=A0A832GQT6_9BACT
MEILILVILGFILYLLFRHLNPEISSSSSSLYPQQNFYAGSLNKYPKIDIDDDWDEEYLDNHWVDEDDHFTSTTITTDSEDDCDLSRALWDPSCPLYSALQDDSDDYHSSWDDDWYSSSSWDDD